jgi:xylulokinase
MKYFLGVDIGTTGTRAVLIDEKGQLAGGQSAEHDPISTPQPQWAEQNPANWWEAAKRAISRVLAATQVRGEDVKGI